MIEDTLLSDTPGYMISALSLPERTLTLVYQCDFQNSPCSLRGCVPFLGSPGWSQVLKRYLASYSFLCPKTKTNFSHSPQAQYLGEDANCTQKSAGPSQGHRTRRRWPFELHASWKFVFQFLVNLKTQSSECPLGFLCPTRFWFPEGCTCYSGLPAPPRIFDLPSVQPPFSMASPVSPDKVIKFKVKFPFLLPSSQTTVSCKQTKIKPQRDTLP